MSFYSELEKQVQNILHEPRPQKVEHVIVNEIYKNTWEESLKAPDVIKIPEWDYFNQTVGGLRMHEFSILTGPTGSGKTLWLANLSVQLLVTGNKQFIASVETGPNDYAKRMMSVISGSNFNEKDKITEDELKNFDKSFGHLMKSNLAYFTTYQSKIEPMRIFCDLVHASRQGCKVAILDNLNFFMPIVDSRNVIQATDETIHSFVVLAKTLPMHLILVMHPRKKDSGDDRVSGISDIKGSSTCVQEASNVFIFNRPSGKDADNGFDKQTYRELMFAKLRLRGSYTYRKIMYKYNNCAYIEQELL